MKKFSLTNQILLAMLLGIIAGVVINEFNINNFIVSDVLVGGVFKIIGDIFLNAIKMLVVPLVFVSITLGVAQMGDTAKLGRIGGRTITFYICTTAFAIVIGLLVANVMNPGIGLDLTSLNIDTTAEVATTDVTFVDSIINMVPSNVFQAFYEGDMLQIIVFAVFFGIAITSLGHKVDKLHIIFNELNDIFLKMLMILMSFAPIAVFSLIITTFANLGLDAILPLLTYVCSVLLALVLQVILVYCTFMFFILKLNPLQFFKNMKSALSLAFTTSSSAGSLPLTKKCVEENCGVDNQISSFVLPIGATINMDGTAIMQGVAVVFVAQAVGVDLTMADYISVIFTATLASIGTAAVPGAGLVMLSMVMTQVGLPIAAIGVIMGVDRILDMSRTIVNVSGDSLCSIFIAKKEGLFDENVYNQENTN